MSEKSAEIYKKFVELTYNGENRLDRKFNEEADRKRIYNFVKRLDNDESYHAKLLKRLSNDDLSYFLWYVKRAIDTTDDNKPSIQRQWYNSLNNFSFSKEFDFRVLDVDCEFCTCVEDLEILQNKQKEAELTLNEAMSLKFYNSREKYGNPSKFKYDIVFSKNICMPFIQNETYISLLFEYLDCFNENEDQKKVDQFHQIDIFLMLMEYSFLEFMKKLDILFDCNLYHLFYNNNDFLELIEQLSEHTSKYKDELNKKLNEDKKDFLNIKSIISYISGYYHLKNINTYHNEMVDILIKDTNIDEQYLFMPPQKSCTIPLNSILLKDLLNYCGENKEININKFKNDLNLLSKYNSYVNLRGYSNINSVPVPALKVNLDYLLDFKIVYHEIICNCMECYNNSKKYESMVNISTVNILKRSVDYIEFYLNDKNSNLKKAEYDYNNYNSEANQKNNMLYKHTVLLTEKIRKGFYREYGMMKHYTDISLLKKDIRNLMTSLYSITDPYFQMKFFAEYYKGVLNLVYEKFKIIESNFIKK